MVCPYRHVADYTDLDAAETAEIAELTKAGDAGAAARSPAPHGFNIGMNQGAVAGAGIAAHLHQHVVPRWGGDANFMPVMARPRPCRSCSPRPATSSPSLVDACRAGVQPPRQGAGLTRCPRWSPCL